jgi:hypothetical protein
MSYNVFVVFDLHVKITAAKSGLQISLVKEFVNHNGAMNC